MPYEGHDSSTIFHFEFNDGEELCFETVKELHNNKGDDEDE